MHLKSIKMTGEEKTDFDFDMNDKLNRVATNVHEDERKIFVGGLPNETKHEDVKTHFMCFGNVEKVKLMSDQATGKFKGFGFVVFEEVGPYNSALQQPEQSIMGRTVTVKRATVKVKQGKIYIGKLPTEASLSNKPGKIFIGTLPAEGISVEDIRNHFSQFGTVLEVVRPIDKAKNDEPKAYAFITFAREEISRQLVKLGGDVLNGHKFNIKPVITKDPTTAVAGNPPLPGQAGIMGGPPNQAAMNHAWGAAAQQAYGYGAAAGYPGYPGYQAYSQHQAAAYSHAAYSQAGYGAHAAYYGQAQPPPPPTTPAPPSASPAVPSLANFNPYDISSYGGGKMKPAVPGQPQARPQPY